MDDANRRGQVPLGGWKPSSGAGPAFTEPGLSNMLRRTRDALLVVQEGVAGPMGLALAEASCLEQPYNGGYRVLSVLPACAPGALGDVSFHRQHGTRIAYLAGSMADGISSPALVMAMARAGGIGFFGAGGLTIEEVDRALEQIREGLAGDADSLPWGANFLHAPTNPAYEDSLADLCLRRGVRRVEASAYLRLTPALVRFSARGLSLAPDGQLQRRNHLFVKLSSEKTARLFLTPPPRELVEPLVARGQLTSTEGDLALRFPVTEDITVEADSGGHTDNRPLSALLPEVIALRDRLAGELGHGRRVRVGAGGGLGTPRAVAGAFAMGADYVLTGSVNQATVEAGLSPAGKAMLVQAGIGDTAMAPSADMFEMGAKVQVLKRGTLFAARATKLQELFSRYGALEKLPATDRQQLEKSVFGTSLDSIWQEVRDFLSPRDPAILQRAERDPRQKMALVIRWYLGKASTWAVAGDAQRRTDFQIYCGPAMGAFNTWAAGSFLAPLENRTVEQIAWNLMEGVAVVLRVQQLRSLGLELPTIDVGPRRLARID